jgi:hypothetical protein
MDKPYIPDIVSFLESAAKWTGDELELDGLGQGDRLLVRTRNTNYLFTMTGKNTAEMVSDRADRPKGAVQIQGCVFGQSRMIKPGHLFCGGGLEITYNQGHETFTTTAIVAIQCVKFKNPEKSTGPS